MFDDLTLPDAFHAPHGLAERYLRRLVMGDRYDDQPPCPPQGNRYKAPHPSDPELIVRTLRSTTYGPGMRNSYK